MTELCEQCDWKEQNRQLQQQLAELRQEQNRFLFERAVIAMMGNREDERQEAQQYLIRCGVRFHGNRFALCAFSDHFTEPGTKDDGAVWERLNSTFYGTLSGFIREEFRDFPAFLTADFNGCILGLSNLPDSLANEDYPDYFRKQCRQLNDRLEQTEGFRFQVFISSIGFGLDALPSLRREVEVMREYWEIVGHSLPELLSYHDVAHPSQEERRQASSREANEQFSDYINRGDFEKAKHFFRRSILPDTDSGMYSATTIRFRIAGMLDYVMQTLSRASQELGIAQALDEIHADDLLLSAQTLDDIVARMDLILDAMQSHWQSGTSAAQSLARNARAFIDENYGDCDLNVNMVAEHLGVSASYLTRVFRNCYQIRVLDYIQQVRLSAAKRLLGNGLTLREISARTGYGAQINLIRAFKRIEGVTPGQMAQEKRSMSDGTDTTALLSGGGTIRTHDQGS